MSYGAAQPITFDLGAIENAVVERYIMGRFPMEIDIRSFEFMGGQNTNSLIQLISALHEFMAGTLQMAAAECSAFRLHGADDKQLQLQHIKSLWTYLTQRLARDDATRSKAPQHTLHKYRIAMPPPLQQQLAVFVKTVPLGLLGKVVLKWKNQLEAYGDVEYNIHTATVNQFLFLDDDLDLPKKATFPTLSLQHFATGFEFVASRFYALSK